MSPPGIADNPTRNHLLRHVRWGDTVRVHFLAWLEDGTMIDSSIYGEPLIFTTGRNIALQGLEELVIGMTVGESRTEKISTDQAFGPYQADLSCQVSTRWLQAQQVSPTIGVGLDIRKTDGTLVRMVITGVEGDRVALDANHPLAGETLILQLDLLDILDSTGLDVSSKPKLGRSRTK
ncbi:MAG: FKBP-type peptidyl-prolyl cis-trans isomerase [Nitrospiraceae bacterium]